MGKITDKVLFFPKTPIHDMHDNLKYFLKNLETMILYLKPNNLFSQTFKNILNAVLALKKFIEISLSVC